MAPTLASPEFAAFARDAETLIDDPWRIAPRLADLLAQDGWLAPADQEPGAHTYRQHLLYVSPTSRLSIVALVWKPGQRTPIHDHVSWCVVGVYRGVEHETRYRLVEVGARHRLEPVGNVLAYPGHVETLVPPVEDIHAVSAAGSGLTISIHVYGADVERLGSSIRHRFDDLDQLPAAA
jgi:predicted metal-dependent enzyme (double-stranded beta helix superfamily)